MPATSAANLAPLGKHVGDPPQGSQWFKWPVQVIRDIVSPPPMSNDPKVLIKEAEELLASRGWFRGIWSSNEEKTETAVKRYKSAGDNLRKYDRNLEAGRTLERLAEIQRVEQDDVMNAAVTLQDAYKAYAQASPEDSIRVIEEVIDIFASSGQFSRAADWQKLLAKQLEIDFGDLKRAIEAYQLTAKWYENDQKPSTADGMWEKVADLAASTGDYPKAIECYDRLIEKQVTGRTPKNKIYIQMLYAGLCHFAANDTVATTRALNAYFRMDPDFAGLPQGQFFVRLGQAHEAGDAVRFKEVLEDFKSRQGQAFKPLPYQLGLRAWEAMKNQEEDFS